MQAMNDFNLYAFNCCCCSRQDPSGDGLLASESGLPCFKERHLRQAERFCRSAPPSCPSGASIVLALRRKRASRPFVPAASH